jgi:hypothetical protein
VKLETIVSEIARREQQLLSASRSASQQQAIRRTSTDQHCASVKSGLQPGASSGRDSSRSRNNRNSNSNSNSSPGREAKTASSSKRELAVHDNPETANCRRRLQEGSVRSTHAYSAALPAAENQEKLTAAALDSPQAYWRP